MIDPATVPRIRTSFVGRRHALERLARLLGQERVVTLTGPGGGGKSRLALRLLEGGAADLPARAFWVPLAPLRDAALLENAVCQAMGVRPGPDQPTMAALSEALRVEATLLVLDNCEHMLKATATLVDTLVDSHPDVTILATSRERLGSREEAVWRVPPLSHPESASQAAGPEDAASYESVQLFVERARAARPDFDLTQENAGAIVDLCRRLSGIPLALELAAARVMLLPVREIVDRLADSLSLLAGSGPDAPPRHRSMEAAILWSYELLEEPARDLFRRLSVFAAGCTVEACEAICTEDGLEPPRTLDLLQRLVAQSLAVSEEEGGRARVSLLEPVRQFAARQLRSGDPGVWERVKDAHARYYANLVAHEAPALRSAEGSQALAVLEREHDNIRLAWDRDVERRNDESLGRLATDLFWFWNFGGHFAEGRARSEAALAAVAASSPARPDLLYASGTMAWIQGDHGAAAARLHECVDRARSAGRRVLAAKALRELAGVRLLMGDLIAAEALYEEAVAELRDAGELWDLALALVMRADVLRGLDRGTEADVTLQEARALFIDTGDQWGVSLTLFSLGVAEARAGNLDLAREHAAQALALLRTRSDLWNEGQYLLLRGEIEERAGDPSVARPIVLDAIRSFLRVGDRLGVAHGFGVLGAIEQSAGEEVRAARLYGASQHLAGSGGTYPFALGEDAEIDERLGRLRSSLGPQAFADVLADGKAAAARDAREVLVRTYGDSATTRTAAPAPALAIRALGHPLVERHGTAIRAADWTYALPRELLLYLLLEGPCTKEQIGAALWPEVSADQLTGRFRTALYHLRQAVGGRQWVRFASGRYAFDRDGDHRFDVDEFEGAVAEARSADRKDTKKDALALAVRLYTGDLLEGTDIGRWADGHRRRLLDGFVDAARALAEIHEEEGAYAVAATAYRRAIERRPWDEISWRGLARALAVGGDRPGALAALDRLEALLREELDVAVSPETAALRARLVMD